MAWGLEARVPFLDKAFLEVSMNIDPKEKTFSKGAAQEVDQDGCPKMEKYILRKAFDCAPGGKVRTFDLHLFHCHLMRIITALPSPLNSMASEGTVL
jgi:hypothetical protein